MAIFRSNAIWLPRIVAVLLLVFTIDAALAGSCCPLTMDTVNSPHGTTGLTEHGPADMTVAGDSGCPLEAATAEHPDHSACCLACVALVPTAEFPELEAASPSFDVSLVRTHLATRPDHLYRPPI
jgi:hypothetical protein